MIQRKSSYLCEYLWRFLYAVQDKLAWSPGSQRALIMIGDAMPHEASYELNTDAIDWRKEVDNLMVGGVVVAIEARRRF